MESLAAILDARQDRSTLSEGIINDTLARWGGLRPLINICFAFDGDWPTDPLAGNPMAEMVRRLPSASQSPSHWISRFYKAIMVVWFFQEVVNFCNIMHWESASALHAFREWVQELCTNSTILESSDVIQVWNTLFIRLLSPLFQLGSPSIALSEFRPSLKCLRNGLRPPQLSDLLILSTRSFDDFSELHEYYVIQGLTLDSELQCGRDISLSRSYEDDSPEEDGKLMLNDLEQHPDLISSQLTRLFHKSGVGHRRAVALPGFVANYWRRTYERYLQYWRQDLKSPKDIFAEHDTSGQLVGHIFGELALRKLIEKDLAPIISLGVDDEGNMHQILAACLRLARRKEFRFTKSSDLVDMAVKRTT